MRIADEIGVDSLRYLSPDGLVNAVKERILRGMNIVRHALRSSIQSQSILELKKKRMSWFKSTSG